MKHNSYSSAAMSGTCKHEVSKQEDFMSKTSLTMSGMHEVNMEEVNNFEKLTKKQCGCE